MDYTITKIDETTGHITVSFTVDNKPQVLAGFPVDDADSLAQALSDYAIAYKAGLDSVKVTVATDIPLNQPQAVQVDTPAVTPQPSAPVDAPAADTTPASS